MHLFRKSLSAPGPGICFLYPRSLGNMVQKCFPNCCDIKVFLILPLPFCWQSMNSKLEIFRCPDWSCL